MKMTGRRSRNRSKSICSRQLTSNSPKRIAFVHNSLQKSFQQKIWSKRRITLLPPQTFHLLASIFKMKQIKEASSREKRTFFMKTVWRAWDRVWRTCWKKTLAVKAIKHLAKKKVSKVWSKQEWRDRRCQLTTIIFPRCGISKMDQRWIRSRKRLRHLTQLKSNKNMFWKPFRNSRLKVTLNN